MEIALAVYRAMALFRQVCCAFFLSGLLVPASGLALQAGEAAIPAEGQASVAESPATGPHDPPPSPVGLPDKRRFAWDINWQGWDGLHYGLYRQRDRGQAWTDDAENPSFPSLFTDRWSLRGKFGGRVDLDSAFFVNGGGIEAVPSQVELRRWRFYLTGDAVFLVPFSYSLNVMAVNNYHFLLDDVYLEFKRIPYLGSFRFGAFIPAMGLESSASSRDGTFMEWGTPVQALAPRISTGWQVGHPVFNERATWSLGQFTQSLGADVGDATKDFMRVIGRLTWLPVDEVAIHRLLHLGLDLNYLRSGDASIRYQSRPESHLAPFMADTGTIPALNMASIDLEAAWVDGPWSVQGEFLGNFVSAAIEETFLGFYVYGSYFWSGESRHYDRSKGFFGRLKPKRDFSFTGESYGALETALRFSYLDLNSGPVQGGLLRSVTAGLNWYLHDHSKIRFNYVYANAQGGPQNGDLQVFETRFEFDF